MKCRRCHGWLLYSARQRKNGLCGQCTADAEALQRQYARKGAVPCQRCGVMHWRKWERDAAGFVSMCEDAPPAGAPAPTCYRCHEDTKREVEAWLEGWKKKSNNDQRS